MPSPGNKYTVLLWNQTLYIRHKKNTAVEKKLSSLTHQSPRRCCGAGHLRFFQTKKVVFYKKNRKCPALVNSKRWDDPDLPLEWILRIRKTVKKRTKKLDFDTLCTNWLRPELGTCMIFPRKKTTFNKKEDPKNRKCPALFGTMRCKILFVKKKIVYRGVVAFLKWNKLICKKF